MTSSKPNQNQMEEVQKLFESNDFNSLEKKLKELISSYPEVANLYNILGVVLQKKNDLNAAISNFKKAINGKYKLPPGPGLGIDIDYKRLSKYEI